jgi:hypothetical protein
MPVRRIAPPRMFTPFANELATARDQVGNQRLALHNEILISSKASPAAF